MPVNVIGTLKPKNNGKFPVVEAADIKVTDNLRLDKALENLSNFVTPEMYGAKGDGVTDDTAAIQETIDNCPNGMSIVFSKPCYRMYDRVHINDKHDISIVGANILSTNGAGEVSTTTFAIENNSSNIIFDQCHFTRGLTAIHLFACRDIKITNCTFDRTNYGILQENGFVSNNVIVANNHANNLNGDFVECNCEVNAPSKNWVVSDNVYSADTKPATYKNECRFIGMTAIENVTITGNIIENVAGNAIHGEDVGGEIIVSNNVIKNVKGNHIDIEDGGKNLIISNNIFKNEYTSSERSNRTFITLGGANWQVIKVVIQANQFFGNGEESNPIDLFAGVTQYAKSICENHFYGFHNLFYRAAPNKSIYNLTFNDNIVYADKLLDFKSDYVNKGTLRNCMFANNRIHADIVISDDGNMTLQPTAIMIDGNYIDGDVTLHECVDTVVSNNMLTAEHEITVTGNVANRVKLNNNHVIGESTPAQKWREAVIGTYACASADTFEYSNRSITVPTGATWEVYITASYSNSYTTGIALSKSNSSLLAHSGGQMFTEDQMMQTPVLVLPEGTYYLWVKQESTAGGNTYRIYVRN